METFPFSPILAGDLCSSLHHRIFLRARAGPPGDPLDAFRRVCQHPSQAPASPAPLPSLSIDHSLLLLVPDRVLPSDFPDHQPDRRDQLVCGGFPGISVKCLPVSPEQCPAGFHLSDLPGLDQCGDRVRGVQLPEPGGLVRLWGGTLLCPPVWLLLQYPGKGKRQSIHTGLYLFPGISILRYGRDPDLGDRQGHQRRGLV